METTNKTCKCGENCTCNPCNCSDTEKSCCKNGEGKTKWKKIVFITILIISLLLNLFTLFRGNFTMDTPWEKSHNMIQNNTPNQEEESMMREHCQMMPEMAGCEKFK